MPVNYTAMAQSLLPKYQYVPPGDYDEVGVTAADLVFGTAATVVTTYDHSSGSMRWTETRTTEL